MDDTVLNLYDHSEADWFNVTAASNLVADEDEARARPQRALYCVDCQLYLTAEQFLHAVRGKTNHHCTNPAGIAFELLCFALAPGIETSASALVEHSWFPPLAWSLAMCRGCGAHRGWAFSDGGTTVFFALIKAHLREGKTP